MVHRTDDWDFSLLSLVINRIQSFSVIRPLYDNLLIEWSWSKHALPQRSPNAPSCFLVPLRTGIHGLHGPPQLGPTSPELHPMLLPSNSLAQTPSASLPSSSCALLRSYPSGSAQMPPAPGSLLWYGQKWLSSAQIPQAAFASWWPFPHPPSCNIFQVHRSGSLRVEIVFYLIFKPTTSDGWMRVLPFGQGKTLVLREVKWFSQSHSGGE